MSIKFYAQKIFDEQLNCVGVELLVRDIPHGQDYIGTPRDIMEHPDFCESDLFSIDMQILTFLSLFSESFKESGIKYIFVNLSDEILKKLILGDDTSAVFRSLQSATKSVAPLNIVVEVNELSRIRKEHLNHILRRLQSIDILTAQDDYTPNRQDYLSINWDFIKLDFDSCCEHFIPNHPRIVIERSNSNVCSIYNDGFFHQGFEHHYPDDLLLVLEDLKKENIESKDVFCIASV